MALWASTRSLRRPFTKYPDNYVWRFWGGGGKKSSGGFWGQGGWEWRDWKDQYERDFKPGSGNFIPSSSLGDTIGHLFSSTGRRRRVPSLFFSSKTIQGRLEKRGREKKEKKKNKTSLKTRGSNLFRRRAFRKRRNASFKVARRIMLQGWGGIRWRVDTCSISPMRGGFPFSLFALTLSLV